MKFRWMVFGAAVLCASASLSAQTPPPSQSQGAPPPATHAPAKSTAPGQTAAKPAPLAPAAAPIQGTVVEDIVARVNDDIVTTVDYQEALANAPQEAQEECQSCTAEQLATAKAEVQKNALRDLIDQALLVQRAKDLGITVETDVVKELDRIRQENKLPDLERWKRKSQPRALTATISKTRSATTSRAGSDPPRGAIQDQPRSCQGGGILQSAQDPSSNRPEMVYLREIFVNTKDKPEAEVAKLQVESR